MGRASREARKAKKLERLEKRKQQLVADESKKVPDAFLVLPDHEKLPRTDSSIQIHSKVEKISKASQGSRFNLRMTWCGRCGDLEGVWSWKEEREWTDTEWVEEIKATLDLLEGQTWADIDKYSSDTGHKMHHGHELGDLCREARRRWKKLGYEEFDSVFRFRTGNTRRAWGVIISGHFYLVWFERNHMIYKV